MYDEKQQQFTDLNAIPTQSPTDTREIDHRDSSRCGVLGIGIGNFTRCNAWDGSEEDGNIEHRDELDDDPDAEGTLAANEVNKEEGADEGGGKLDDTKDSGRKKGLGLPSGAQECKELRSVDRDRIGATPFYISKSSQLHLVCRGFLGATLRPSS